MDLGATFCGTVEDNKDPEKLGRLKVRVPMVYGCVGGFYGAVATNDLPWSLPAGLPNGLSQASGGADWTPEIGDQVLIRFLDREPEKPVWEWFMQTLSAAASFPLHAYNTGPGGSVGGPKRGAWVRYGHTLEWNTDGMIMTTSKGYRVLLTDSSADGNDGDITIETQAGQFLEFDDSTNGGLMNVNEDMQMNIGKQLLALCDSISLQSQGNEIEFISGKYLSIETQTDLQGTVHRDWTMDVDGKTDFTLTGEVTLTGSGKVSLAALTDLALKSTQNTTIDATGTLGIASSAEMTIQSQIDMNLAFTKLVLGQGASSPFVLGDQLLSYLEQMVTVLLTHTHGGVTTGSGATAPMLQPLTLPTPGLLSQVIVGK